jgi:TonB family protein
MESTIVGGSSPGFAAGNTRMGRTESVAVDGAAIERLPEEITPPIRKTPERPDYPPDLRERGIEGDVVLEVEIDARGAVNGVVVAVGSGQEAFDRAARAAAERSQYEPAKKNGVPVAHSLRFTVRFRLH